MSIFLWRIQDLESVKKFYDHFTEFGCLATFFGILEVLNTLLDIDMEVSNTRPYT